MGKKAIICDAVVFVVLVVMVVVDCVIVCLCVRGSKGGRRKKEG